MNGMVMWHEEFNKEYDKDPHELWMSLQVEKNDYAINVTNSEVLGTVMHHVIYIGSSDDDWYAEEDDMYEIYNRLTTGCYEDVNEPYKLHDTYEEDIPRDGIHY